MKSVLHALLILSILLLPAAAGVLVARFFIEGDVENISAPYRMFAGFLKTISLLYMFAYPALAERFDFDLKQEDTHVLGFRREAMRRVRMICIAIIILYSVLQFLAKYGLLGVPLLPIPTQLLHLAVVAITVMLIPRHEFRKMADWKSITAIALAVSLPVSVMLMSMTMADGGGLGLIALLMWASPIILLFEAACLLYLLVHTRFKAAFLLLLVA